ncbi:alpha/beta fold hydrolase [Sinisalibacter aestuarii]|uniref:Transcriptional regulator n=1 Tax=Sinisalibacter aestuarii TaxID=2949426 RepID=A0ABQ5LVL0_9RHOB|nr:alpha/beta fold hydrolase [Sinisalibacter aestuarii]GKY89030.1 transcriptional regulator [Sinisalibacter aestuarii]
MEFRFADCILDVSKHRLLRAGKAVDVEPQVFSLLRLLAEKGGDLVTRDDMIEVIWQGRFVSDSTISARVSAARSAVGDNGRAQAVIHTVVSRGIQLVVPVESTQTPPPAAARAPRPPIRLAAAADGTGLAWCATGEGPALLRGGHWLTHLELDWDNPVWRPLLEWLGQGRRLIRYDMRGTGLSQRDGGAQTLDLLVDDMKAVADAAGADTFDIFAPSQNVPVAIAFAARYPERVRRLVLLGGFLQGAAIRGVEDKELSDAFVALARKGWSEHGAAYMRAFAAFFMPDATPEQVASFVEMQRASISPEGAVALRRAISRLDASDYAARVAAPTLVVHARNDAMQPFAQAQILARTIPNAQFLALESANHIPLPQDPAWELLMSEVGAFLSDG